MMSKFHNTVQGYLYINIPRVKWIVLFSLFFWVFFLILKKRGCVKLYKKPIISLCFLALLAVECAFIFIMTLFGRTSNQSRELKISFFESYYIAFVEENMESLLQVIMNVVMFIPLGFLLPCCFQLFEKYRNVVITTSICSLSIELIQLFFKMGLFEVDDILNNTLGAGIGVLIHISYMMLKNMFIKESTSNHATNLQEDTK